MMDPTRSSLSGLNAFGMNMAVTSHNVANVETDGFKKSRTILQEANPSGVTVAIEKVETPGAVIPVEEDNGGTRESSNVDIAEEMTHMITTQRSYDANLKAIKTWDEMMESVLNLFA
jgi:flagellar basal-body rod protein FlgC